MAAQIDAEFCRWHDFDKSVRLACHSTDGVIELMPITCSQQFAFKYVNGHPKNTRDGLPTVMTFGVLADVDTGAPRLLSELTITTAIRTAAMSALAAQKLARHPGLCSAEEVTIFDSVGFALEDYAALRVLNQAAAELGIGKAAASGSASLMTLGEG
jgi:ornithine cyclodeaminase/alanine dehydrogenase-like protein (mu-crystallin family)